MADEVPAREVAVTGDCGFKGNGGGARSGSELSHLTTVLSLRHNDGMTWREGVVLWFLGWRGEEEEEATGWRRNAHLHGY